jgi:hypothetical protein
VSSSANPSTVGASVTFTASVTGFGPTGSVNFTDGGSSITGCAAVALSGAGNSRTAQCSTSALSAATHSIVANYGGDASNTASASAPLSQVVNGSASSSNVALATAGAVASASSTYPFGGFAPAGANNGDRKGVNWGNGGGWHDAYQGVYPQWLQITFAGAKTITEIDVFTVQDNYTAPVDPTNTLTFSLYGITDFQVQYWAGSAWVPVPGGTVTGNNNVWRRFTFAALTTDRIRIYITGTADGYSRLTEVEAWGS